MRDSAKQLLGMAMPSTKSLRRVSGADPLIGKTIDGRYRIECLLGEGGMGLVYRALHIGLQKSVAIKALRPEASHDDEVLRRFRQEAQSASAIGNQHIVDVLDFGTLPDGSTYFAMEHLQGIDLIQAIEERKRLKARRSIHIAKQLCRALGAAHKAGIVHRDLKPENVYLVKRNGIDDFVKVLDFGIAKVAGSATKLTKAGEVFGTPHYMSPEQAAGGDVDQRTDIYALGVILYEMVTGDVPHDADNMMGILTKHLYEDPIPPSVRVPDLPQGLEDVIQRCMEKNVDHRYQSMAEVESDLERIEAGEEPVGPDTVKLRPTRSPRSRALARIYFMASGVAAFAMLGALLVVAYSPDDSVVKSTPLPVSAGLPAVDVVDLTAEPVEEDPIIKVRAEPEVVAIYIDGQRRHFTPWDVLRSEMEGKTITLDHPGYRSQTIDLDAADDEQLLLVKLVKKPAPKARAKPKAKAKAAPAKDADKYGILNPFD